MIPIAFFHSADMDGQCSGAIIDLALGGEVELVGYDYGQDFPWDKIKDRDVIMADISIQPSENMITLFNQSKSLTWIDHHKSAMEDVARFELDIPGLRVIGKGACELCWEYFMPGQPIPDAVRLLGRYDVWDHSDPDTLPFQYGIRIRSQEWERLLTSNDLVGPIRDDGRIILQYQTIENAKRASALAFETELDGLRCIAANIGLTNSQLFDSVWDPKRHDVMMPFYRSARGHWSVSLYSTKGEVDCSLIAKSRGGGGHAGAAGFQCSTLPFEISKGF